MESEYRAALEHFEQHLRDVLEDQSAGFDGIELIYLFGTVKSYGKHSLDVWIKGSCKGKEIIFSAKPLQGVESAFNAPFAWLESLADTPQEIEQAIGFDVQGVEFRTFFSLNRRFAESFTPLGRLILKAPPEQRAELGIRTLVNHQSPAKTETVYRMEANQ